MPEQNKPFVITDRRKFTLDGEPRPDADPSPEKVRPVVPPPVESSARIVERPDVERPTIDSAPAKAPELELVSETHEAAETGDAQDLYEDPNAPPPPTPEQMAQSKLAYDSTADRIDTAIRAANPGMEHAPPMSFERLVQSVYMTAIMQLGGATPQGQKPQVDLMGARQSIDMLTVVAEKTSGNLSVSEGQLIDSALFELRLAFLDITQALSRSAAAKQPVPGTPGFGPSIVR
jgi:hypothetical protein